MFPINVDSSWYNNHWYRDANEARPDRKIFARIAIFLVAVCVAGLLGSLALTPQGIKVGRTGLNSTSSYPPRVAIAARQRTSCRRTAASPW
jgi:hypothetical protein